MGRCHRKTGRIAPVIRLIFEIFICLGLAVFMTLVFGLVGWMMLGCTIAPEIDRVVEPPASQPYVQVDKIVEAPTSQPFVQVTPVIHVNVPDFPAIPVGAIDARQTISLNGKTPWIVGGSILVLGVVILFSKTLHKWAY